MPDPHKFFDSYIEWLKEFYPYISYFVELDLQSLLGMDVIRAWRQRIVDEGLADKCIMVHHSCNDDDHLDELIKTTKSGYIGFEGKMGGTFKLPYMKLLKKAYEAGIKVHGFALTSQKFVEKYPFYSVDSSSWTACTRYGILYKWQNGKMHQTKSTDKHFFKHNIPAELHNTMRGKDMSILKLKYNEKAFREMQDFYTKVWERRGIHWKD
jgi:hypothetical protein